MVVRQHGLVQSSQKDSQQQTAMITTVKKTGKLSALYIISDLVTRGVDFLAFLLYTRYLTPADYGVLAIIVIVSTIIEALLSFGLASAIIRFYYQITDEEERKRFYGAMWTFLILIPLGLLWPLAQYGEVIFTVLFRQIAFDPYIRAAIWIGFLNVAFTILPTMLYRAQEKAARYLFFGLLRSGIKIILIVWFVIIQQDGVVGAVNTYLVSSIVVAVIASLLLMKEVKPNLQWRRLRPAFAYGIPLVPHVLAHWGLNVSDRAILERYVSLQSIGVYAFGYQFGTTYNMVVTSFNNALVTMFSQAAKSTEMRQMLPTMVTYYVATIVAIGLAAALLVGQFIIWIMPAAYHDAVFVIPWVILAYLAMGFYYIPMNLLSMTIGKTKAIPLITASAALANIGLNLWLIPMFGMLTAAVTTAVAFIMLAVLMLLVTRTQAEFHYEYGRLSRVLLLGFGLYCVGHFAMVATPPINILIALMITSLFPVGLTLLGFWTAAELDYGGKLWRRVSFQTG